MIFRIVSVAMLCIAVCCISIVSIFFDSIFLNNQFIKLGSYERQPTVMQEAKKLMWYRVNDETYITSEVYTEEERLHLYDVKKILQATYVVEILAILISGCMIYVHSSWSRRRDSVLYATLLFAGIWISVAILFAIDFAWLFELFHRSFFRDNRAFPSDYFLIQSYPEAFFYNAGLSWLLRAGILWIFLNIICEIWNRLYNLKW